MDGKGRWLSRFLLGWSAMHWWDLQSLEIFSYQKSRIYLFGDDGGSQASLKYGRKFLEGVFLSMGGGTSTWVALDFHELS